MEIYNEDGWKHPSAGIDPKFMADELDLAYVTKTVYELANTEGKLGHLVREALEVIEESFQRYGFETVSLSFNGGKDCTVLLHLVAAVLSHLNMNDDKLRTVYVTHPNPFENVNEFVNQSARRYNLDCHSIPGPMKQALQKFLDESIPRPKAILVGIRRNDPYAENLTHFDATDAGWPQFTRVHPIINWNYKDIWNFILKLRIPYCSLYDKGYTSLGSQDNTFPNPHLQVNSSFLPAYELDDQSLERCGRVEMAKK